MTSAITPISFIAAMRRFFGLREGQTLTEFSAELKALNDADRAYFRKGLEQNGYVIAD